MAGDLAARGILTFNPLTCFNTPDNVHDEDKKRIMHIGAHGVLMADVLYVNLPSEQHSVGTCREIQIARTAGMPVIVVTNKPRMVWLVDCEVFLHHPLAMEKVYTFNHEWKQRANSQ